MTGTLQEAAHNTALILDKADRARELLAGDGSPRSKGAGVLANPRDYLAALQAARELIGQAIALHDATAWPEPHDYQDM
jgi:hypothetical protein